MYSPKKSKGRRIRKNILLYFKEAKWSFLIILIWFIVGFFYFLVTETDQSISDILLYTFYIQDPPLGNPGTILYNTIGTIIISQGVFAFIIQKSFEKRDTKITSRLIAQDIRAHHVVIIHHGHVGTRITDYFRENNQPYILIERDRELVEELLDAGEPVIVGEPISEGVLQDASIHRAKAVVITENNAKTSLILMTRIRKLNPDCKIYVRIFDDRLGEILEQPPYNGISFSTSRSTITRMKSEWVNLKEGKAVVIGISNFTKRLVEQLVKARRETVVIDERSNEVDFYKGTKVKAIEGDPTQIEFLETPEIDVASASQVFVGIKEAAEDSITIATSIKKKYPSIEVKMRLFSDELAEFLEQIGIETFSTSLYTFNTLKPKLELLIGKHVNLNETA
jgi:Trk K+ transport system NAD-binding subunit